MYALGVVAFEMMAGRTPFDAPTAQALYAQHFAAPCPSVRQWRPEVPAAVEGALALALAKDRDERFATAGAFAAALVAGLVVVLHPSHTVRFASELPTFDDAKPLLIAEGAGQINPIRIYWWLIAFPGGLMALTLLALNFVGDGLRDAWDVHGDRS